MPSSIGQVKTLAQRHQQLAHVVLLRLEEGGGGCLLRRGEGRQGPEVVTVGRSPL